MEPQKNLEHSISNNSFNGESFFGGSNQNYEQFSQGEYNRSAELQKNRSEVFSVVDKFQANEEVEKSASAHALPQVQETPAPQINVPSTATDADLMEDIWVKNLKKMIQDTKGDPYSREMQFRQMQVDYLKKRYNRIINGGK